MKSVVNSGAEGKTPLATATGARVAAPLRAILSSRVPLFMDIHHDVDGDVDELLAAHRKDLEAQERFGVRYLSWWFNPHARSVCCLVDAPDAEAAAAVHMEAHGTTADKLIPVERDVVEAFLGGGVDAGLGRMVVPVTGASDGGFRTILFTDITDSTGITQRLGDVKARKVIRLHDDYVRTDIEAFGGRVVKHTGDGAMVVFSACSAAVRAAIVVLRRFADHNARQVDEPLRVRIGISAGEPVDEAKTCSAPRSRWPVALAMPPHPSASGWRTSCASCARARSFGSSTWARRRSRGSPSRWPCTRCRGATATTADRRPRATRRAVCRW